MIYIINGSGGCGKDTFVELCDEILREHFGFPTCMSFSTIDHVKEAAKILGWDGIKDDKGRKFLSDLKRLSEEYDENTMSNILLNKYKEFNDSKCVVMFIHIREPKNIDLAKKLLPAETLLIRADQRVPKIETNASDASVDNYEYDHYIDNNDTLEKLRAAAKSFLNKEFELFG